MLITRIAKRLSVHAVTVSSSQFPALNISHKFMHYSFRDKYFKMLVTPWSSFIKQIVMYSYMNFTEFIFISNTVNIQQIVDRLRFLFWLLTFVHQYEI